MPTEIASTGGGGIASTGGGGTASTGPETPARAGSPTLGRRALVRLLWVTGIQLGFLAALLIPSACSAPHGKLTAFDVLALPGEQTVLKAKLERDGPGFLNLDVSGVEIEFLTSPPPAPDQAASGSLTAPDPAAPLPAEASVLGVARTDGDGIAEVGAKVPAARGNHRYWARLKDPARMKLRETESIFTVCVLDRDTPLVITDIDNTILSTRARKVLADEPLEVEPLPDAAQVLMDLSRNHRIVYLTARSSYLAQRTRRWLAAHQFPAGPVLLRDLFGEWRGFNWSEAEFKRRFIRDHVKKRWPVIRWGIGNTEGDATAYAENDIRAIILATEPRDLPRALAAKVQTAADWSQVRKIVEN